MPEVTVTIGERHFLVSCQDGEEHFLRAAAKMVDGEAMILLSQIGRMPEVRMLLMSSLLLADKTAGMEDQVRQAEAKLLAMQAELDQLRATPLPAPITVEVPMVPPRLEESLAEFATWAESLATRLEERRAG